MLFMSGKEAWKQIFELLSISNYRGKCEHMLDWRALPIKCRRNLNQWQIQWEWS